VARIVSIEKGALGTVKAVAEDGSLFLYKAVYLEQAFLAADLPDEAADGARDAPFDVPDDVLTLALEATLAESRALALLARAEQYRAGLERKLAARDAPRFAIKAALDMLEADGLLSDGRYAGSWIRQRVRSRAEGPRSLSVALSARGVDRHAIRQALAEAFEGDEHAEDRRATIVQAASRLLSKGALRGDLRGLLIGLGWRSAEVDEALDSLES